MTKSLKIHRHLGKFFVLPQDHVNSFIVETDDAVIAVDTTLAISSAREMREKINKTGKKLEVVLLTHGHPDHYSGIVEFPDVDTLASQGCLEFAHREDDAKAVTAKAALGDDWPDERAFPNNIIKHGDMFDFGGLQFQFRDIGPAESDSDGMWITEHEGTKHVFLGDTLANKCHSFFRDGHVFPWLEALEAIETDFDENTLFYMGHGEPAQRLELVNWQRGYINTFIEAVKSLKNTDSITEQHQKQVVSVMQGFLPGEATLFLTQYELDKSIEIILKQL